MSFAEYLAAYLWQRDQHSLTRDQYVSCVHAWSTQATAPGEVSVKASDTPDALLASVPFLSTEPPQVTAYVSVCDFPLRIAHLPPTFFML